MSEGTFDLNKPGYYTVQNVEENEFLNNRLESDQYGIYYSVKFLGDAETFLWQTKTEPLEGQKYYGHIEQSKSGKSLRFKKDKLPDDAPKHAQTGSTQSTDESIARAVALRHAAVLCAALGENQPNAEGVLKLADTFLTWLKNESAEKPKEPVAGVDTARPWTKLAKKDVIYDDEGAPIDIPPELL